MKREYAVCRGHEFLIGLGNQATYSGELAGYSLRSINIKLNIIHLGNKFEQSIVQRVEQIRFLHLLLSTLCIKGLTVGQL